MNSFVAFRCQDGSYLLVPHAGTAPWFENPSVDFLGDVDADSFERAVTLEIENQVAKRKCAWISKDQFHFSWSQARDGERDASSRARALMRSASNRKRRLRPALVAH